MKPYEELANAIIIQATIDYREVLKYLKQHPRTKELEETVAQQIEQRKKRRKARNGKGLPMIPEKRSREELLLHGIVKHEKERDDIQQFFRSDWFETLTSVDGEILLKKLNEEV